MWNDDAPPLQMERKGDNDWTTHTDTVPKTDSESCDKKDEIQRINGSSPIELVDKASHYQVVMESSEIAVYRIQGFGRLSTPAYPP